MAHSKQYIAAATAVTLGLGIAGGIALNTTHAEAYSLVQDAQTWQVPEGLTPLFVSAATGSDSNAGDSKTTAYATLDKALARANAERSSSFVLVIMDGTQEVNRQITVGGTSSIKQMVVLGDATLKAGASAPGDMVRLDKDGKISTAATATLTLDGSSDGATPQVKRLLILTQSMPLGSGNYVLKNASGNALEASGALRLEGTEDNPCNVTIEGSTQINRWPHKTGTGYSLVHAQLKAPQGKISEAAESVSLSDNSSLELSKLEAHTVTLSSDSKLTTDTLKAQSLTLDHSVAAINGSDKSTVKTIEVTNTSSLTNTGRLDVATPNVSSDQMPNTGSVHIGPKSTWAVKASTRVWGTITSEGTITGKEDTQGDITSLKATNGVFSGAVHLAHTSLETDITPTADKTAAGGTNTFTFKQGSDFSTNRIVMAQNLVLERGVSFVINQGDSFVSTKGGDTSRVAYLSAESGSHIQASPLRKPVYVMYGADIDGATIDVTTTKSGMPAEDLFKLGDPSNGADVNYPEAFKIKNSTINLDKFIKARLSGTYTNTTVNSHNSVAVFTEGSVFDQSRLISTQDEETNTDGTSTNLILKGATITNSTLNVSDNRIDVRKDSTIKDSTLTIDHSSSNTDNTAGGALRLYDGSTLTLDSAKISYTNPLVNHEVNSHMPLITYGQWSSFFESEKIISKGNTVIDTPVDLSDVSPFMNVMSYSIASADHLEITGGSYQFFFDPKAMTFKQQVQATNGPENGNAPLKLFTLRDSSKTALEFPTSGSAAGSTYTYQVEKPSQDGKKHIFAPYYDVTYSLGNQGMWPDGSGSSDLVLQSMAGYALADAVDVNNVALETPPTPTGAPGKVFKGWKLDTGDEDAASDATDYTSAQTMTRPNTQNTRYVAKWEDAPTYGVTYHNPINNISVSALNDQNGTAQETSVLSYRRVGDKNSSFSLPQYVFTSWTTEPDGTGTTYEPGQSVTIADTNESGKGGVLNLYAQFKPYYPRIAFSASGGTFSNDSVFKRRSDIFTITTDQYGGETAVLNKTLAAAEHKTLGDILAQFGTSMDDLGLSSTDWQTTDAGTEAVTRDKYRRLNARTDPATYATTGWFSDNQGVYPITLSDSTAADQDVTYYVGYAFTQGENGKGIDQYFARTVPIQADVWINSASNTTRIVDVLPNQTFSGTAAIDMSAVKRQLTAVDKEPYLRNWAQKPYATAYPDARSTFVTELSIPEGINAQNATVTPEGTGQLFVVKNVERHQAADGSIDKLIVTWELKQSVNDKNQGTTRDVVEGEGAQKLKGTPEGAPWVRINDFTYDLQTTTNTYYDSADFKARQINTYGALKDAIWSVGTQLTSNNAAINTDASKEDDYGYQEGRIDVKKNMIAVTINGLYVEDTPSLKSGDEFTFRGTLDGNFSSMAVNTVGVTKAFDFNWTSDQIASLEDPRTTPGDVTGAYATVRVYKPEDINTSADLSIQGGRDGATSWNTESDVPYYVERTKSFALRSQLNNQTLIDKVKAAAKEFKQRLRANGMAEKDADTLAYETPLANLSGSLTGSITLPDSLEQSADAKDPELSASKETQAALPFISTQSSVDGKTGTVKLTLGAQSTSAAGTGGSDTGTAADTTLPTVNELLSYLQNADLNALTWENLQLTSSAPSNEYITATTLWSGMLNMSFAYQDGQNRANDVNISRSWSWTSSDQTDEGRDATVSPDASEAAKNTVQLTVYTHDPVKRDITETVNTPADLLIYDGPLNSDFVGHQATTDTTEALAPHVLKPGQVFDYEATLSLDQLVKKLENLPKDLSIDDGAHNIALENPSLTITQHFDINPSVELTENVKVALDEQLDSVLSWNASIQGQGIDVNFSLKPEVMASLHSLKDLQDLIQKLQPFAVRVMNVKLRKDAPLGTHLTSSVTYTSSLTGTLSYTPTYATEPDVYTLTYTWEAPQTIAGKDAVAQDLSRIQLTIVAAEDTPETPGTPTDEDTLTPGTPGPSNTTLVTRIPDMSDPSGFTQLMAGISSAGASMLLAAGALLRRRKR